MSELTLSTRLKYLTFSFLVHWSPVHFQLTQACTSLYSKKKKLVHPPFVCMKSYTNWVEFKRHTHCSFFYLISYVHRLDWMRMCMNIFRIVSLHRAKFSFCLLLWALYIYISLYFQNDDISIFKCAHFRWYKLQRRILFIGNNNTHKFYLNSILFR